jgi:hypothetical protein
VLSVSSETDLAMQVLALGISDRKRSSIWSVLYFILDLLVIKDYAVPLCFVLLPSLYDRLQNVSY